MMQQLTLGGREADEKLVGVVFERKNKLPSPCVWCDVGDCVDKCFKYRRWEASDGKDPMLDRYGRFKAYYNLRY